jgi:hypothetical protein
MEKSREGKKGSERGMKELRNVEGIAMIPDAERGEIVMEDGEGNETITKSQRKELKRQQNLEWKWRRGEADPNPRHTEYYRRQLPELSREWSVFQETLAKDLPVTFRLSTERNAFVCSRLKSKLLSEVLLLTTALHLTSTPTVSPNEREVHRSAGCCRQ